MTFDEIMIHITATIKHHRTMLKERAVMDHKTAELMAFAVNDPSKMPSVEKHYSFMDDNAERQPVTLNNEPDQTEPEEWQSDQALLVQQAMAVRATNERKKKC
ncbi:hypothetical protein KIK01_00875 [Latilactobacillus sakei subsp. sakei]|nr:hypothetical protein KIK01_00875 [Latilactobacillus sakei subsp. sakei]